MSHYILYNPLAGNGTCERRLEALKSLYSDAAEFVDMTKIESYADFARKLLPDDVIVIAGGDGTLNRFVNDIEGLDIKNQILYVHLTSSVLRQELMMGRDILVRNLNEKVGAQVIVNIIFR